MAASKPPGSIREVGVDRHGEKVFLITLELPHEPNERNQIRERVHGAKAAQERYAQLLSQLYDGTLVTNRKATTGWLLDRWLKDHVSRLEDQTDTRYEGQVRNHLKPGLGDVKLSELDQEAVDRCLDGATNKRTKEPLSDTSKLHLYRALIACLNWGAVKGFVQPVVAQRLEPPKMGQTTERPVIDGIDLLALLPMLAGDREYSPKVKHMRGVEDKGPLVCYLPAVLIAACGLRLGEVCGLQWPDVDLKRRILHVRRSIAKGKDSKPKVKATKTRTTRVVPLPVLAHEALSEAKVRHDANVLSSGAEWNPDGWIVPDDQGGPRLPRSISSSWHAFVTRYPRWEALTIYDLRHTYASLRIAAGEPVTRTAALLGHSSPRTTMTTYAHAYATRDALGDALMDDILGAARAQTRAQKRNRRDVRHSGQQGIPAKR